MIKWLALGVIGIFAYSRLNKAQAAGEQAPEQFTDPETGERYELRPVTYWRNGQQVNGYLRVPIQQPRAVGLHLNTNAAGAANQSPGGFGLLDGCGCQNCRR